MAESKNIQHISNENAKGMGTKVIGVILIVF